MRDIFIIALNALKRNSQRRAGVRCRALNSQNKRSHRHPVRWF